MKKRKKIFDLLCTLSLMDKTPKVRIKGCQTGATLYEGGLFEVPYKHCMDYVLQYEICDDVVAITSTYSSY